MRRVAGWLCLSLMVATSAGAVPLFAPVQGYLTDAQGTPTNGPVSIRFSIYATASATTALWTETQTVTVASGYFTASLGQATPIPLIFFRDNATSFLGMAVGTDAELTPRLALQTVPYAFHAAWADDSSSLNGLASGDFARAAPGPGLRALNGGLAVDSAATQARVSGTCAVGSAVRVIAADGTVTCQSTAGTTYTGSSGVRLTGTNFTADTAVVQARVGGTCAAGSSIRAIAADGTVTCQSAGSAAYTAGAGLILTGTQFSADTNAIQQRVSGTCTAGSFITGINAAGGVTCAGNSAGTGISISAGTVSADTAYLQRRVSGTCAVGSSVASVAADGTVTCEAVWRRGGNAGTTAGTDYIGTSDNQALEIKVNGARVARFEPPAATGFRVVSTVLGDSTNAIDPGIQGAAIGGGMNNQVKANLGSVFGGENNSATGQQGAVVAGYGNSAGTLGFVGAGYQNIASGYGAAVSGGMSNHATAQLASIPGGLGNVAAGVQSFAAGTGANAAYDGCFVWSDSSHGATQVSCTAANQFIAQGSGGVTFWTNSAATVGVSVAAGGASWASASDRNVKKDFVPVKPAEVLEKVVAMPITTWSYKTEERATHMGPMAQDFYAAFKLGQDDKHIVTVDADGVALAAIQGLNQKTVALQHENAQLHAQLDDLKKRLDTLEARRPVSTTSMFFAGGLGLSVLAVLLSRRR